MACDASAWGMLLLLTLLLVPTPCPAPVPFSLLSCRLVPHMLHFLRRTRPSSQLPSDDLLSVGLVGLRRAAARYDPGRKTRFSTVATVWILQVRQRSVRGFVRGVGRLKIV